MHSILDEQHCVLISREFSVKQLQILFGDLRAGWIIPAPNADMQGDETFGYWNPALWYWRRLVFGFHSLTQRPVLNGGDIYWNPWVSWNHFRHAHAYMYSLTFSQLPMMLFLWAKNRQLSGTWLEKMCACNTLCHILQEAAIKQSLYLDCLDTVAVGGDKWKKKPILSVIHFASNSPSLCAAVDSEKIKQAKTKQKSRHS